MVYQIDNFLIKCNTRLSVIIFVFAIYIFSIIYNITLKLFSINYALDNFRFYDSPIELIFFAIILAPLLETFLFQFLIFKILLNKNIGHYFIIILSAFIFSLVHYPRNNNIFEAVNIFFVGLMLAYAFYIYSIKQASAFWHVVLIHALLNAISIFAYYVLTTFF